MAKEGKTAVLPKLRFPEFRDAEEWAEKPLNAICEVNPSNDGLPESFIYIDLESVERGVLNTRKRVKKIEAPSRAQRLLKKGDVVFQIVRPYQRNNLFVGFSDGESYVASTGYAQLRAKESEAFLFQAVHTDKFVERVIEKCTGSNYPAINSSDLANVRLPLPPTEHEQQKIADCLSSADALITAQGRKIEALKTYKRGLMQQLLPREGETLPRLRFSEFASDGWHTQKIASLLSKASISANVEPDQMYREIGIRSHGKGIFHKEPTLGKVIGEKRVFQVVQDALVLNIVFAWEQAVATTTKNEIGMIASHRFPMYVAKPGKCDVEYVKGFFLTKEGKRLLGVASPGGAGRNKTLGQKEFENLEIALPVSVDEQTRIANCLSSLDTKITIESDKLESLKAHKQGLMQQLFPSLEEA